MYKDGLGSQRKLRVIMSQMCAGHVRVQRGRGSGMVALIDLHVSTRVLRACVGRATLIKPEEKKSEYAE
jgi:hypothetical protein